MNTTIDQDISDEQLINNIKNNILSSESLDVLYEKYSKVYYQIIHHYFKNNDCNEKNELIKECKYNIYFCALDFKKEKGAKFSSYLGNKARWLCLTFFNKSKKIKTIDDSELQNHEDNICLYKHISSKETIQNFLNQVENDPDYRIKKIFNLRYFSSETNKLRCWREIADQLGLSVQGCINIHNDYLKKQKYTKYDK
jgi:hypothetical protein